MEAKSVDSIMVGTDANPKMTKIQLDVWSSLNPEDTWRKKIAGMKWMGRQEVYLGNRIHAQMMVKSQLCFSECLCLLNQHLYRYESTIFQVGCELVYNIANREGT